MSHVHCPACRYAFNLATSAACPRCAPAVATVDPWPPPPPPALPLDAVAAVDAALDQLSAALARLADDELDAVALRLAATEHPDTWAGVIAGAIAAAAVAKRTAAAPPAPAIRLELEPPVEDAPLTPRERALATMVLALLARLAARLRRW